MLGACNSSSNKNEKVNGAGTTTTQSANEMQQFNLNTTKLKTGEVFYQYEMHPKVTSDKAGKYAKCGMDLVQKI